MDTFYTLNVRCWSRWWGSDNFLYWKVMKVIVQSRFVINSHKDQALSFFSVSYSLVDLNGTNTIVHVQV
jgi:hypothetical protein